MAKGLTNEDILAFMIMLYAYYYGLGILGLALQSSIQAGIALILTLLTWKPVGKLIRKMLKR